MVSTAAAERFLAAPWLAEMDAASRQALLAVLREGRAPADAVLLSQGQTNDRITFLTEGSVAIVRSYPGGRDEVVATLHAPSVFGETSFFRRSPSIVWVRALEPLSYLTLDRDAHEALRRADPRAAEQLALAAVRVLADRFDMLDRRVSDFLAQPPEDAGDHRHNEWAAFRSRLFEEQKL